MSKKTEPQGQDREPDHLIRITAGSGGTVLNGKLAIIRAGAEGVVEIPLEEERRKITWNGTLLELVALLELLEKAGYISAWDSEHYAAVMQHHFHQGGQEIKSASVREMKYDDYEDRRIKLMDRIHQRLIDAIEAIEQPEE